MLELVKEYTQIKVVLQDLPAVVEQGKDVSQNKKSAAPERYSLFSDSTGLLRSQKPLRRSALNSCLSTSSLIHL